MEGVQHFQLSRKAYRSHLTRIYKKVSEIVEAGKTPNDLQVSALKSAVEQLQHKADILRDLDAKIADAMQDETELEGEIFESKEMQDTILEKIGEINYFLERQMDIRANSIQVTHSLDASAQPFQPSPPVVSERPADFEQSPRINSTLTHDSMPERHRGDRGNTASSVSHLPKLNLPTFSGEPLSWQTFWDSFSTAVDSNHILSGVQKFNYLRAQLHGEAASHCGFSTH